MMLQATVVDLISLSDLGRCDCFFPFFFLTKYMRGNTRKRQRACEPYRGRWERQVTTIQLPFISSCLISNSTDLRHMDNSVHM